jgi:ABC-type transport system involved in multi-copper enzyme maturation permease subunit
MVLLNLKNIYTIMKKEFTDNIRNKWIIIITIIFIILTMTSSYLAGGQTNDSTAFGGMEETVVSLIGISSLLIPLIAILLGFSTISGEAESGALSVILSYPIRRIEVLIGKFFGLSMVITISSFLGFGLAGVVIALTVGTESGLSYLAFILLAILLGMIYLSVIICISSVTKKRITSIGGGILLFFWSMIYGIIVLGIFLGSGGNYQQLFSGTISFPDWFWASVVFSPTDMNQMTVMKSFGLQQVMGFPIEAPEFLSMGFLLLVHLIWIIIPLILAYFFFKRRDI